MNKQYRPRLSEKEYEYVKSIRDNKGGVGMYRRHA